MEPGQEGDVQELTPEQRQRGQRYAIIANVIVVLEQFIMLGAMMMLYSTDVLHFSPKDIGAILALTPLIVLARIPFVNAIRRFGKVRTLRFSVALRALMVLVLMLIPARILSLHLYIVILLLYTFIIQAGAGVVWQPLMRDITTHEDRGQFFGRMRFIFTTIGAIAIAGITMVIGEETSEIEYKALLAVTIVFLVHRYYWLGKIPEVNESDQIASNGRHANGLSLWQIVRTAPLLRRPLFITLLVALTAVPVFIVYLRQLLYFPANMITLLMFISTVGAAGTLLLWGRVADVLGFRPLVIGLLGINILMVMMHFFLIPMRPELADWSRLSAREWMTFGIMAGIILIGGALGAGIGIGMISIQHFFTRAAYSIEEQNVFSIIVTLVTALGAWVSGVVLEDYAMPFGSHSLVTSVLEWDGFKIYLLIVVGGFQALAIWQLMKLPNLRPVYGVSDFFSTMFNLPLRALVTRRSIYHEDEQRRLEMLRWYAQNGGAMSEGPLLELLDDPSHDVKLEAIRALARMNTPEVGRNLLGMLEDPRQSPLVDEIIWALGECRFLPSGVRLIDFLGEEYPARRRALATRALGKLGNGEHDPKTALAALLGSGEKDLHVVSGASRALLRLNAHEHVGLIFQALTQLEHAEESYELLDILCRWLGISNFWLLRSSSQALPSESLRAFCAHQSARWHKAKARELDVLEQRDFTGLMALLEANQIPEHDVMARTMLGVLERQTTWQPLAVLAVAWLMLRPAKR